MLISKTTIGAAAILLAALLIPNLKAGEPASVLLQKGIFAEETEGDLKAAIELYRKLVTDEKTVRSVAAQAQFRLAVCLQKQGNKKEAVAAIRELIAQFPAQEELLVRARKELASLGAAASEIKLRKVMINGEPAYEGVSETRLGMVSPDARYFSFTDWRSESGGNWLRVRNLKTGEFKDITQPQRGSGFVWNSIWSPDGQWLAYWSDNTNGSLKRGFRVSRPDGSETRTLIPDVERWRSLFDWSSDGKFVLGATQRTNLVVFTVKDGSQRIVKKLEHGLDGGDFLQGSARFSPDGRYIAYTYAPDPKDPFQRDIFLLTTDGSNESVLVAHPAHDYEPIWTPDGKAIVFASNRTGAMGLWLLRITDGKAQGEPQLIHQTNGRIHPKGFAKDGLFYYDVHLGEHDLFVVDVDPQTGKPSSVPARLNVPYEGWNQSPSWSPDGNEVAFIARPNFTRGTALDEFTRTLLCVHSLKTGQTRELATPMELKISAPAEWSADGRRLVVAAWNATENRNGLYHINAQTGEATVIFNPTDGHNEITTPLLTPDGNSVIYALNRGWVATNSVVIRNLKSNEERELWNGAGWLLAIAVSPDGGQLAMNTLDPSKEREKAPRQGVVRMIPLSAGESREVIRFPKGQGALGTMSWSDGEHLLFPQRHGMVCRADAKTGAVTELGVLPLNGSFSLQRSGRKIVFTGSGRGSELWAIEGLDVPEAVLPQQAKARESAQVK